jgi:hypothetical protein
MISGPASRIAELLDNTTAAKAPRTPAQSEVLRVNAARSQGRRRATGSRDRAVPRPPAPATPDAVAWQLVLERRSYVEVLTRVLACCDRTSEGPCREADAELAAMLLDLLVQRVQEEMAEIATEESKGAAADTKTPAVRPTGSEAYWKQLARFEAKERRQFNALAALVMPARKWLGDRGRVAAVLCGKRKARRGQMARMRSLLLYIQTNTRNWLACQRDLIQRIEVRPAAAPGGIARSAR